MSSSSWILPSEGDGWAVFDLKKMSPKLVDDKEILSMPGNYMMYPSRREAVDSLIAETAELSIRDSIKELTALAPLKWEDRESLTQYALSRFAIVIGPPFMMTVIPLIKFRVRQFERFAHKEHPEWWI